MSPISILDSLILFVTKKITRQVYLVFGVHNFKLAYGFTAFSLAASSTVMIFDRSFFASWIVMCLANTSVFLGASYFESRTKEKFMNPARKYPYCYIRVSLAFKFLLLSWVLLLVFFTEGDSIRTKVLVISAGASLLAMFSAVFFASVEPENPTDSLLKKFGKWLKSLLETSTLPQPA
ncbi:MAG: hypothetical protein RLZZ517_322 [Candidatus Parcubacteria bacterium]